MSCQEPSGGRPPAAAGEPERGGRRARGPQPRETAGHPELQAPVTPEEPGKTRPDDWTGAQGPRGRESPSAADRPWSGRLRRRELPDERGDIGPRPESRRDLLHLHLRLPSGRLEHAAVIDGSQVRCEQPHRREADRAALEEIEDHGKAPGRPADRDAVVGLLLGEREDGATVREQRAVAGTKVNVAGVELREVRHQQHRGLALAAASSWTRATSSASESCRRDARRSARMPSLYRE